MRKLIGYVAVFVAGFGACALILRIAGTPALSGAATSSGREDLARALAQPPAARAEATGAGSSLVAQAAARVEPAVVNIDVSGEGGAVDGPFGYLQGDEAPFAGSGSGIILSGDGFVVTNDHVIEDVAGRSGGGDIVIKLDNGRTFTAVEIVGRDPRSDLAVLKIRNVSNLPAARLGDSDALRVGDWALAVGNPLGFNSTVTLGIISAVNRRGFRVENDALDRVIQTDAAINPGSSGGALADIAGRVIGINTAIASTTGAGVGIGFAIPINPARRIIDQLVKQGKVVRPYLGIVYQPLAGTDRETIRLARPDISLPPDDRGVLIVSSAGGRAVAPGSPAALAGLREYDVLREIGGRVVADINVVKDEVQKRSVGDKLSLLVWRGGRTLEVSVVLKPMPERYNRSNRSRPRRGRDLSPFPGPELIP